MKKLLAIIITLMLALSITAHAAPETIDLTAMSWDELDDLIDRAKSEQRKLGGASEAGSIILDNDGVKVTFGGVDYTILGLEVQLIIENGSQKEIIILVDDMYINGWEVTPLLGAKVESGKIY